MKRSLFLIIVLLALLFPIYADSESLRTEIISVTNGPYEFGFNMAPTGTNFMYYDYFQLHPALKYDARFRLRLDFRAVHNWYSGFHYMTGTPKWANKYHEIKSDPFYNFSGEFFNPSAYMNVSLYQGFGTNPVSKEGYFINLGIQFDTRYSMALESLDTHIGEEKPKFIDPKTGEYIKPFGPGSKITAYPWLQDTRNSLINAMLFEATFNFTKSRGFKVYDGLELNTYIEVAPYWLGNTITMDSPTANYYHAVASMTEYLTLYSKKQDNGRNWLSIQLKHSNRIEHIGGTLVPLHKLNRDRLENYFADTIAFNFNGPQFIAGDCYTDMTLGLYNYCYFGHILNEPEKTTYAVEWVSKLELGMHMRLFGFMHFKYTVGYTLYDGIHTEYPGIYQNAKVSFYIAL